MSHQDHKHDNKSGGCCGGDKHHSHAKLEKEKDGCCDGDKDKKPDTDQSENPQTQGGGCCGGGHN